MKAENKPLAFIDTAPPDDWICAGCGETACEWGHVIDEDCVNAGYDSDMLGQYECNCCGCQEWMKPDKERGES
jgi:hypothetical protein